MEIKIKGLGSIEERAKMFGLSHTKHIADSIRPQAITRMHDLYKEIATEQKALDIAKACEWWDKELREVNYGTYAEVLKAFKKAMEQ